jgi:hypothetical protein
MITLDDLKKTHSNFLFHVRGSGYSKYGYQSVEFPVLSWCDYVDKKKRKTTRKWIVSGHEAHTIDEALRLLNEHQAGRLEPVSHETPSETEEASDGAENL